MHPSIYCVTCGTCGNPCYVSATREKPNEQIGKCELPILEHRVFVFCCLYLCLWDSFHAWGLWAVSFFLVEW